MSSKAKVIKHYFAKQNFEEVQILAIVDALNCKGKIQPEVLSVKSNHRQVASQDDTLRQKSVKNIFLEALNLGIFLIRFP